MRVAQLLPELGVSPIRLGVVYPPTSLPVMLNGCLYGYIDESMADHLDDSFRVFKSNGTVGETTEMAYVPRSQHQ